MQLSSSNVIRVQIAGLYAANLVCALISGLFVALPIAGAAFLIVLSASCLTTAGCDTPTVIDQLVVVVGAAAWLVTAVEVGVLQIRTLHCTISVRPSLKLRIR